MLPVKPLIRQQIRRQQGFYSSQTELEVGKWGSGEVGEPRRAAPVPTVGAARTPKFNAPISRLRKKTPSLCSRQETPGCRQEKSSHSRQPWNFHSLSAASPRRGQTRLGGCGQASTFQLTARQVHRITVFNA